MKKIKKQDLAELTTSVRNYTNLREVTRTNPVIKCLNLLMYILNYLILNSRGRLFELRVPELPPKTQYSFFVLSIYFLYTKVHGESKTIHFVSERDCTLTILMFLILKNTVQMSIQTYVVVYCSF